MILILGGTTEGRMAVKVADGAGSLYYYATRGSLQQIVCKYGIHLTGGMDLPYMIEFCRSNSIRLLIDAAHPFAMELHRTVAATSEALQLPVVRVERTYPEYSADLVWCDDYEDAIKKLKEAGIVRLLALTGVQTIGKLQDYWKENSCWFRILRREESLVIARSQGFDERNIVYYEEEGEEELISRLQPQALLTKESGDSGGFSQKVEAAKKFHIPVYVVKRPVLPGHFVCVTGEHGLRKQIETHVSGFFPLRSGFTTGACATAASKAALLALLSHGVSESVSIRFPNGEELSLPIANIKIADDSATATVVKDAGDDPDVTDGKSIVSTVRFCSYPGIHFLQGEGVGVVTLPGLGLEVTVSVPGGRELAQRTFNLKLGIIDGISIIGTSGIVRPFSSEAFVNAIRREVEVCKAVGCNHLVINSGARSERFLKAEFPELPMQAFVHFGNFIGETLRIADEVGMEEVTLGIMIGKAVKLAEGHLDTHSKKVVMNKSFLKQVAVEAECSNDSRSVIDGLTLARELWNLLSPDDAFRFFSKLIEKCYLHCRPLLPEGKLTIRLMDEEGRIFNQD